MKITYKNFKEVEIEYAKYVAKSKEKILLHIIYYPWLREVLLENYTDQEIKYFFELFPYILETITEQDKLISMKIEIDYHDDLRMVEFNGVDYVLFDKSSEGFEKWDFPKKVKTQPIPFSEFMEISFDEFVDLSTGTLLRGIENNLRTEKSENVSWSKTKKEHLYI